MGVILSNSSWQEVTARYPELGKLPNATSPEVQNTLISYAEAYVHGKLSTNFSVPFSCNNFTARDLVIDALYMQNVQTRQPVKGKAMLSVLDDKINALVTGRMQMVDVNGTVCQLATGDPTWSNTMNYTPTFGMENPVMWAVNSQMMIDENNARGSVTDEAY